MLYSYPPLASRRVLLSHFHHLHSSQPPVDVPAGPTWMPEQRRAFSRPGKDVFVNICNSRRPGKSRRLRWKGC